MASRRLSSSSHQRWMSSSSPDFDVSLSSFLLISAWAATPPD